MTYRERRERKAERLREWAEKRRTKSAAAFNTARTIADGIPFGQPILVGHHSEKRHRRDVDRIHNGMANGIEHERKAGDMESRAANIEAAADRAIYSDDDDAIEKLRERIELLEAERARIKAASAAIRKHGLARLLEPDPPFVLTEAERKELLTLQRLCPYHQVETKGFPAYHLQNLGGNIGRQRKRLEQLERDAKAQQSDCTIEFDAKPAEDMRAALKARGWRWSGARALWYHADTPEARLFAAFVNEHQGIPTKACSQCGAFEPLDVFGVICLRCTMTKPTPAPADTVCPDGPSCPDPACIAERARRDVMQVIGAAYQAIDEDRDPIAAVAEEIARVEAAAPAIAEVPFSLSPVIGRAGGKQGGLF